MDGSDAPLTLRVLPAEEWERLRGLPPFDRHGLPSPDYHEFVVVEQAGQVVGYWCMHNAVHLEPLFITEEARRRGSVLRLLMQGVVGRLNELGVQSARAHITAEDAQANLPLALKFGFQVIPGTPLFLDLSQVKEY